MHKEYETICGFRHHPRECLCASISISSLSIGPDYQYSRAGPMTALYVVMSVSFCLPHPVAVSVFIICSGVCDCTEMLWMCMLYARFESKVRPRTFGCVAMVTAVLFISRSRLLLYSAGSRVNRVQVVLSGFRVRVFWFDQAKTLCMYVCMYGCMYVLTALVLVYRCDGDVICVGHDLNRCYVCIVNVE